MKNTRRFGFTIVELLVVISIIAVLLSLLLSGLNAASATGRKTKEMNRLKQVLYAWLMYSGQYEDKLLPGFWNNLPELLEFKLHGMFITKTSLAPNSYPNSVRHIHGDLLDTWIIVTTSYWDIN